MGSNINYLYRKFSELNAQVAMRTELSEFLKFSNQEAAELIKTLEECNRIGKVLMHKKKEMKG